MRARTDESELAVFMILIANIIKFLKQLDEKYNGDGYSIDKLFTAVDKPEIKMILKERMPRKAQKTIHGIENRLSNKPKTAGIMSCVMIARDDKKGIDHEVLYAIGRLWVQHIQLTRRTV